MTVALNRLELEELEERTKGWNAVLRERVLAACRRGVELERLRERIEASAEAWRDWQAKKRPHGEEWRTAGDIAEELEELLEKEEDKP